MNKEATSSGVENLDWIDALRGIAIFMVVASHVAHPCQMPPLLQRIIESGAAGVELFYVVSAFTLARSWERRKAERAPVRNFFIRRFFRIAPLYWVVLALSLCIFSGVYGFPGMATLLTNFTFTHGWHPDTIQSGIVGGWSVGIEMSFYLLVPWIADRLRNPWSALALLLVSVPAAYGLTWVGHLLYHQPWPCYADSFLYFWLPCQFPAFAFGFVVYAVYRRIDVAALPARVRLGGSLLFCMLAVGFGFELIFSWHCPPVLWPTVAGGLGACVTLAVALVPWKILVNPFSVLMGKLSYGIYLLHTLPSLILTAWLYAQLPVEWKGAGVSVAFFLTVFAGNLFLWMTLAHWGHRWVEVPGIAWGKRLISRLEKYPATL